MSRARILIVFGVSGTTTRDLFTSVLILAGGGVGFFGSSWIGSTTGASVFGAGAGETSAVAVVVAGSSTVGTSGRGIFGGSPSENGLEAASASSTGA
jgi:hypothetical protein